MDKILVALDKKYNEALGYLEFSSLCSVMY